jgi:signal transduction histidine kinase
MTSLPVTAVPAATPVPVRAPNVGRRRFARVCDALVVLGVLSVVAALYLGSLSLGIISEFIGRNELWAGRQFALTDLQRAATFLIAPGNDLFRTKDVEQARAVRDRALAELDAKVAEFKAELAPAVPEGLTAELANAFDMLAHERDMLVSASDKVFAEFAAGRLADARLAMVAMDQRLFELSAVFGEFNRIFQQIQRREFATQSGYAREVELYKYLFAALVMLLTAGALAYGIRLRGRLAAAEANEQRYVAALQERERQLDDALRLAHDDRRLEHERLLAIGRVAATVSHEVRNPLAAIGLSVAVIRDQAAKTGLDVSVPIKRIERNIGRCVGVLGDLVDFSGSAELNLQPVDFDSWIGKIVDAQPLPDGIDLRRSLAAGAGVEIDAERLERAVVNLLRNAADAVAGLAGESRGRWIAVESIRAGASMRLRVADNGSGIPADILPRIFDPLFTTKGFGAGLGLPIARKVVEQHGGTIAAESGPHGTAFTIELPQRVVAGAA